MLCFRRFLVKGFRHLNQKKKRKDFNAKKLYLSISSHASFTRKSAFGLRKGIEILKQGAPETKEFAVYRTVPYDLPLTAAQNFSFFHHSRKFEFWCCTQRPTTARPFFEIQWLVFDHRPPTDNAPRKAAAVTA